MPPNTERLARGFVSSLSLHDFRGNRMAQLAVIKAVETVGEAASRVSASFAAAHAEIPWRAIVGMRNRLVYDYAGTDPDRVWETARNDIPRLIALLEPLVPPEIP